MENDARVRSGHPLIIRRNPPDQMQTERPVAPPQVTKQQVESVPGHKMRGHKDQVYEFLPTVLQYSVTTVKKDPIRVYERRRRCLYSGQLVALDLVGNSHQTIYSLKTSSTEKPFSAQLDLTRQRRAPLQLGFLQGVMHGKNRHTHALEEPFPKRVCNTVPKKNQVIALYLTR